MANLIIKSSADNLVLQGSDASPAITVGATGVSTIANATITAGTFPAGHVLQTVFYATTGQPSVTAGNDAGTAFASLSTAFKKAITPTKNNSDILVTISMMVGSSTVGAHLFVQLYDNTNSVVLPSMNTQGHFGNYMTNNAGNTYGHIQICGSFLYENPTIASTPNSIEIEVKVAHHGGSTFYLNRRGTDATYGKLTSTIVLQEIAG